MYKTILIFISLALSCFSSAYADILYLQHGGTLDGIITEDRDDYLELQVSSFGYVKFSRSDVLKIEKGSTEDNSLLKEKWEEGSAKLAQEEARLNQEEKRKPREVEFFKDGRAIFINATINGSTNAKLLLDTGAAVVMLSRKLAETLGIDLETGRQDAMVQVADGRKVPARYVLLKSIQVQGVEEENVDAVVLMEDVEEINVDGLLGMSFLKRFNFKIDYVEEKLILEKH